MAVRVHERFAILLAKDSDYPAPIAYYLAHELGHIALGHLQEGNALIDLTDPLESGEDADEEERAADRFALELLTGTPEPTVSTQTRHFTAEQLAQNLLATGQKIQIEPGTLALCFGHTTGNWAKAYGAMKHIYTDSHHVWLEINRIAQRQLHWPAVSEDMGLFIRAVIGGLGDD